MGQLARKFSSYTDKTCINDASRLSSLQNATMQQPEFKRLLSLDALRGLDLLIIIGLDRLAYALAATFPDSSFWQTMGKQLGHAEWEGLHAYDLVFPLFVFISGISMCFSQHKAHMQGKNTSGLLLRLWKRAALLILLGWLVNGPLSWDAEEMRYASVLGLIGLSCAIAGTLSRVLHRSALLIVAALALLGGVWWVQSQGGDLTPAGSVNAWLDSRFCPGKLHDGTHDPEGILCIVSATALALSGFLCGRLFLLRTKSFPRLLSMLFIGGILLAIGWKGVLIKSIWTPPFVLTAAGTGFLLMALFHLTIDLPGWRAWNAPLRVVGTNALFIYLLTHVIPFGELTDRLFGGTLRLCLPESWLPVGHAAAFLLLAWLLCFGLYRKGIFIRV